jgi:hypothetical protein
VRSHEARRREAYKLIVGEIGAVVVLFVVYAVVEYARWRAVVGLTVSFLGASYLFVRELQPIFVGWDYTLRHPEGSFSPIDPTRTPAVARLLIRALAQCSPADIATMVPSMLREVWLKAAGFGAIAVGTLVQIIASWRP